MMPCPSCKSPTKPWDTEPSHGHLTYAYECRCGNEWTEDMDHLLRRSSDLPRPKRWKAHEFDVIDAVRDVLPDEWRVLPTGGSTAKTIARRAAERYEAREQSMAAHPAGRGR